MNLVPMLSQNGTYDTIHCPLCTWTAEVPTVVGGWIAGIAGWTAHAIVVHRVALEYPEGS